MSENPGAGAPGVTQAPVLPGEPGGLGRRVVALIIDWTASIFLAVLIFRDAPYGSNASMLYTASIYLLEATVLTWLIAASFGQRIMGLAVVGMNGANLAPWRTFVRTLLILLVIPAVVIDSNGRGLHDRIVGSMVIRRAVTCATSAGDAPGVRCRASVPWESASDRPRCRVRRDDGAPP